MKGHLSSWTIVAKVHTRTVASCQIGVYLGPPNRCHVSRATIVTFHDWLH
jgi:hypothetical protein